MKDVMNVKYYKHAVLFYFLAIFIPWVFWFIAAYLSHVNTDNHLYGTIWGILLLLGLASPMVIAFVMMGMDSHLRGDLLSRLFTFSKAKPFYIAVTFFLMPVSILVAQGISLLFGYSVSQFEIAINPSFSFSLFPVWFILFLAPLIEELGWHSYGTDCLRARFNLFTTSIIFAVFWEFWHFPLSFIKGYYQSNLVEVGWFYSLNFWVSLFPFVFLMNWLYYKTNRNILVAIIFHITAVFFNEIFSTAPMSKVIQTVLLCILTIFIIWKDRDFFFKRELAK